MELSGGQEAKEFSMFLEIFSIFSISFSAFFGPFLDDMASLVGEAKENSKAKNGQDRAISFLIRALNFQMIWLRGRDRKN